MFVLTRVVQAFKSSALPCKADAASRLAATSVHPRVEASLRQHPIAASRQTWDRQRASISSVGEDLNALRSAKPCGRQGDGTAIARWSNRPTEQPVTSRAA